MIRLNYHPPGTPPATLVAPETSSDKPVSLTLMQYNAETLFEGAFDSFEELIKRFDPEKTNWINIGGLGNVEMLRKLGEKFNLHPLALEDVLNTTQRPKVEHYADHFFVISEMIYFDEEQNLSFEQLSMFLGENVIITIQEEDEHDIFDQIRARLRSGRGYARKMKSDYLAYILLDATVDQFFPILEQIGDSIENLEEMLLEKPDRSILRKLYDCKRLLIQLRRAAWPQREIFSALIRDDIGLISRETEVFLRDCYDHTTQIIDILESYRDLAAGLMDIYLSSLGVRTNEIMRILTVFSVLFLPLTFIAGVYGMNFDTQSPFNMPELHWHFGYVYFWILCMATVTVMLLFFKRKKWL